MEANLMEAAGALEQQLLAWLETGLNAKVTNARRLVGGNRRRAWSVDLDTPSGQTLKIFLRFASQEQDACDPYDLRREAAIYQALAGSGVPIARVYALHPTLQAVALERVEGESSYRAIAGEDRKTRVAQDFMRALDALHRVDARSLTLPVVRHASIAEHVREELVIWRGMYEFTGRADPLIEFAFAWLAANVPQVPGAPVVVHGDAGPGNFMFAGDRVSALVDWELWHLGDPIEDLAWLSMRCTLEPFPAFAQRVREYEELSGAPVDRARLLYHRILVCLRVVIVRHRALVDPSPDSDPGNSIVSRTLNRRLLTEVL
ncbi:MAG: phosphotransferase family protein, partial [Pseudomonadota bacterium]